MPSMIGAPTVARWARLTPDAVAVREGDAAFTYQVLALDIVRAVVTLRRAGSRRGKIVGIECESRYLHLVLILATEVIGGIHWSLIPANLAPGGEMADQCDLAAGRSSDRMRGETSVHGSDYPGVA